MPTQQWQEFQCSRDTIVKSGHVAASVCQPLLAEIRNASFAGTFSRFPAEGGHPMFDVETTALLRAVLDEVCEDVSRHETGARAYVAAKLLEAATNGETSVDDLKRVGRSALGSAPTMWR